MKEKSLDVDNHKSQKYGKKPKTKITTECLAA